MRKIAVILGDCLFADHAGLELEAGDLVVMIEDRELCTRFRYHSHKIVLFLAAMRSHANELGEKFDIFYRGLDENSGPKDPGFFEVLGEVVDRERARGEIELVSYEIDDDFFVKKFEKFVAEKKVGWKTVASPKFLTEKSQFQRWLATQKSRPKMANFYAWQRARTGILVDEKSRPVGGKWSFDAENRKKFPREKSFPEFPKFAEDENLKTVKKIVGKLFAEHPGAVQDFRLPTTRAGALKNLENFLEFRLAEFGPWEDAFEAEVLVGFHSVLSPLLNCGLLTPAEVLEKTLDFAEKNVVSMASLEGFVRQILGWREFVKGCADSFYFSQEIPNFWGHERKLTEAWWHGETGIPPLDAAIGKAVKFGYLHHIERLMVVGNLMLLCEISPEEVFQWFMELFVDSADWVMLPNVLGMSQFADGGIFATKPYFAGSNYLLKMSHFARGPRTEIVDGLFRRFVEKNQEFLSKNPRLGMMVKTLGKMDAEKKTRIFAAAEKFLVEKTG